MRVFLRLFKYIFPYKGWVTAATLTMIFGIGFDLLSPWLLMKTIDVGISEGNMQAIILYSLLLAFGQLVKSAAMYVQGYSQEKVGQNVIFDLRKQLYHHLQRLSFGYYDKAQTGQIMSRMTGDIEAVKNFVGFGAMQIVTGAITFIGTIVVMLLIQWKVTLISMATVPLLALALWQFNRKVGPAWSDIREQMGRLTTTLQENISGIRVVKAFAQEKLEKSKFSDRNETNFDSNMNRAKIESRSFPLMNFYGGVIFLLMIWVGGIYVYKGEMTIGELTAFQWYAWGIIWPLNMLGWLVNIMQQAIKAAPRVFEILDTPVDIDSPSEGGISAKALQGYVDFREVTFRFPGSDKDKTQPVLKQLSFSTRPGQAIAILGPTGSGKSSLIQLMARFYDTSSGQVLLDGRDVREYNLQELRTKIGIVPQETFLFSATIRDNIAFGQIGISQEQIEWAARKAQIHDFITTMPNGYDTLIGERGVGLSGGQRQRVALARALLMDPPILILDEATASVDTATESAIHEALDEVMEGRTTFIVAQRLSSIQRADWILVLDEGRIVEQGTHKDLLESDGFFRKLFRLQMEGGHSSELQSFKLPVSG
ncbi:ABC transporter ATP-binding protein [Paenibacillus sp. 32O-W]|uniref:ABC transporter ATP-binding protein n=1 Tax=Paenibacillus sp. 32O-W TaxID=1695218 RepID=UPI0021B557D1|nr:ABC transporter ATP-binding protein [Paenibacillus sp. 32O-W]